MKNLLFGALFMPMGTFAFAANEVENHAAMQNMEVTELLNANFGDLEGESLNAEGCNSTVYVYSKKTKKFLRSFVRWDPDCDADYQMEIVYI